jgi:hypothetical protein
VRVAVPGVVPHQLAVLEVVHALGVLDGVADQVVADLLRATGLGDVLRHVVEGLPVGLTLRDGEPQLALVGFRRAGIHGRGGGCGGHPVLLLRR